MRKELEKVGLDCKEISVYLALLELGQTTVSRVAQKSKIKRTTIYDVLKSLGEKGLIGKTISGKTKYYFAEDPRILEETLKKKQEGLASVMPQLLSVTNFLDKKPKISFYEGKEGVKALYRDSLNYKNQPLYAWFPNDTGLLGDDFFIKEYVPGRIKNKINVFAIIPSTSEAIELTKNNEKELRRSKYVKNPDYRLNVEIVVYGSDKVFLCSFKDEMGLIIQAKGIHDALKNIFLLVWNSL